MSDFNKEKIFQGTARKVLIREFAELKNDYNKLNALSYKQQYADKPLSFLLENSDYIFREPMVGLPFYRELLETATIPFNRMKEQKEKLSTYVEEYADKMSPEQKEEYTLLLEMVTNKCDNMKHCIRLYDAMMEDVDSMDVYYDALYEYSKTGTLPEESHILSLLTESGPLNIMDYTHIFAKIPEYYPEFYSYMESVWVENPSKPEEYLQDATIANTLKRMLADSYMKESVDKISNMNLRLLLKGIAGVTNKELMESAITEVEEKKPIYVSPQYSVNSIYESTIYQEMGKEHNDQEKVERLMCELAVLTSDLSFLAMETTSGEEFEPLTNLYIESMYGKEIDHMPQTEDEQQLILSEAADRITEEINSVMEEYKDTYEFIGNPLFEAYFKADGSPSRVIANSVGAPGNDAAMQQKKRDREPDDEGGAP